MFEGLKDVLQELYAESGLGPDELSRLLGQSRAQIYRYLTGPTPIPHPLLGRLLDVLGVDLIELDRRLRGRRVRPETLDALEAEIDSTLAAPPSPAVAAPEGPSIPDRQMADLSRHPAGSRVLARLEQLERRVGDLTEQLRGLHGSPSEDPSRGADRG
ncbi:MAG: helix-turn-helix transcriptional regulator [Acidobacteriota bacterium]